MEFEHRPLDWFRPYARHPRVNDHAIGRLEAVIRAYGFKVPILARSNGDVVDGDLRLKVATKMGLLELPVILCDEWSPAQVKAFRLVVNRSVSWAHWDEELLALELEDLKTLDFDLSLTGFDGPEIDLLLLGACDDQQANSTPGAARPPHHNPRQPVVVRSARAPSLVRRRNRSCGCIASAWGVPAVADVNGSALRSSV